MEIFLKKNLKKNGFKVLNMDNDFDDQIKKANDYLTTV